jgi:multiple sugar transport system ATP-binding protein
VNAVRFDGVDKRFDSVVALSDLVLEAPASKFLALLGPSGCGKTTALRILAGLETPTAGRVFIGDRDVTRLQPRDRDVAMVFQSYALYPHMTIRDNIAYPLWLRDVPEGERRRKVEAVARSLEVDHLLDRRPRQLSGGQRQRIALARAIVRDPTAFLMDEPLSNLDARLRLAMRGEIKRLCHDVGATTIYVTHDQAEATTMADLVAVMGAGSLQQVAPPEEIYDRPANRFVATFVGSPPMNILSVETTAHDLLIGGKKFAAAMPLRETCRQHSVAELGIRPEDVRIVAPDAKGAIAGEVYVVEPMGSETLVAIRCGGERVTARVEKGFRAAIGSKVGIGFDIRDACFFDASGVTVVHRAQNKGGRKQ